MIAELFGLVFRISPNLKRPLWRMGYDLLARRYTDGDWAFMNYGYAELDPLAPPLSLRPADEVDRHHIQLYHRVVGRIDVRGRDVLEVGCGRGGGCSYVMRYLGPRRIVGVDLSHNAVQLCRGAHAGLGIAFLQGDAESLPFADHAFDVVVNVESAHCYGSMKRFLGEVSRILRPRGYFVFADVRSTDGQAAALRRQVRGSGMEVLREDVITPHVLLALEKDNARKVALIRRRVPRLFQRPFAQFAGVQGTRVYEALRTGRAEYLSYLLRKDGTS